MPSRSKIKPSWIKTMFGLRMPTGEASSGSEPESSKSKDGKISRLYSKLPWPKGGRGRQNPPIEPTSTVQAIANRKDGIPTDADIKPSNLHHTELEQELAQLKEEIARLQAIESAYHEHIQHLEPSKFDDKSLLTVNPSGSSGPLVDDYVPDGKRDDHYFATKFNEIRIRIREWVVLTFFKPGVNPAKGFLNLSPAVRDEIHRRVFKGAEGSSIDPERIDSKMARCILQAYIADALNEFTFDSYVPGIEKGQSIPVVEELMAGSHASDSHSWKTLTLGLITKTENYLKKLEQKTQEFTLGITNSLCEIYHISTPSTSNSKSPPAFNSRKAARNLAAILKFSTALVLEMRNEPFMFETYMCKPGELCAETKWPVSVDGGEISDDETRELQRSILFTLFPALIRHGRGDVQTACLVKGCVVLA